MKGKVLAERLQFNISSVEGEKKLQESMLCAKVPANIRLLVFSSLALLTE